MQPTVTIKCIRNQWILKDEKYQYLLNNLNKPLPLAGIWWTDDGTIDHIIIRHDEGIITLFSNNRIKGEFLNGIKFQLG